MPRWTKTIHERFFDKVEKTDSCWIWTGAKNRKNYGMFVYKGRVHMSHRVSYMEWKGEIPDGKLVCHTCDNPSCVNPDHLFVGSNQDNMDDMKSKGRQRFLTGENNKNSKLTWQQVREIRSSDESVLTLAKKYGVSDVTIYYVLKEGWKE